MSYGKAKYYGYAYSSRGGGVGDGAQVGVLALGATFFLGLVAPEHRVLFWWIPLGIAALWIAAVLVAEATTVFIDWWTSDPVRLEKSRAKVARKLAKKRERAPWTMSTALVVFVASPFVLTIAMGLIFRWVL